MNIMCNVNPTTRPAHCQMRTNLCCVFCQKIEDCFAEAEAMKKQKPCDSDCNTVEDPCPFAI